MLSRDLRTMNANLLEEMSILQSIFGTVVGNQSLEEQKLEKDIYDSIVTDTFKAVSVTKDHIYIVVE